jgi:hypothetical protein
MSTSRICVPPRDPLLDILGPIPSGRLVRILAVCAVALGIAGALEAEDIVRVRDASGELVARRGEVVRYSARELQLKSPAGQAVRIPADVIVEVQTERTEAHVRAERAFEQQDYATAMQAFREAYGTEQRDWVRQEIVARLIVTMHSEGQTERAAAAFLGLLQADPETRFLEVIPLAWRPAEPDLAMRRRIDQWIAADQPPAARLLAASWLVSGARRGEADTVLQTLQREQTPWLQQLATAQRWRLEIATSDAAQVARWQAELRRIPDTLQPGPAFVLARAQSRHQQTDAAVLHYLRAAWASSLPQELRRESLQEARTLLIAAGRPDEAQRLGDLPSATDSVP